MPAPRRTPSRTAIALAIAALGAVALGAVALGAIVLAREGSDPTVPAGDPPNILVIMTDDQTVESMRALPSVNALIGAEGVTFEASIVTFPLCCPSRATFLTGQYSHNHGVRGNQVPLGGYESFEGEETTLPAALQAVGYDTVHVGKYLNGYGWDDPVDSPPGWTEWFTELDPRSQRYTGFTMLENGTVKTYTQDDYSTDVFTELATDAIERRATGDDPWFLTVSYFAPHADLGLEEGLTPATPAPRHRGAFEGEPLPTSAAFDEADVSDKPASIQDRPRLTADLQAEMTTNYARYLESLLAVDEGVEQLMATLEDTGQLEDTVVIFTSDNGYFFGEHRIPSGKVLFYEPSIRVPLLMRGPGVPVGETLRSLVANIDLAPTILDLAGASSLRTMDGESLVPLFGDPAGTDDRAVLLESPAGGPSDLEPSYGVRTSRYVYVEHTTGERELYDLSTDPQQLDNLTGDPALVEVETDLDATLARLQDCVGSDCR